MTVQVGTVDADSGSRLVHTSGVVRATARADLPFTIAGRVAQVYVEVGDEVEEGAPLVALEREQLSVALRAANAGRQQAGAQLGLAARSRRRARVLSREDALSSANLDEATAAVRSYRAGRSAANAEVAEVERLLSESTLSAPFAGTVTAVLIQEGEMAAPGHPVVVLSGASGLEVEIELSEARVGNIAIDDPVVINLPLGRRAGLAGHVTSVARSSAALLGRQFPVIIHLDDTDGVLPGMMADVELQTHSEEGLSVPLTSVFNPGGANPYLFLYVEGRVQRIHVELGDITGERVTVMAEELSPGQQVVVAGHSRLQDGDEVSATTSSDGSEAPTAPSDEASPDEASPAVGAIEPEEGAEAEAGGDDPGEEG